MELYDKIRKCRLLRNMTQSEIAARIPTSQSNYSKIESGQVVPDAKTLKRICEIMQISSDYLLDLQLRRDFFESDYALIYKAFRLLEKIVLNNK